MSEINPISGWTGDSTPAFAPGDTALAASSIREPAYIVRDSTTGGIGIALGGQAVPSSHPGAWELIAVLPALYPEWLGDRSFAEAHGTRFAYVTGAMANGIATVELVSEMARIGALGFFGAGGLAYSAVEAAVSSLSSSLDPAGLPWGSNLIHSPNEPALEAAVADLYIRRGVRKVSAAAYMSLTPSIVRYAYSGIGRDATGTIVRPNSVFAKVSRPEVARAFMNPAPEAMLSDLVATGQLTADEAALASTLAVAEDFTIESDSGGHTDNRPLAPLFSAIQSVRDETVRSRGYGRPIRLGAAGGIGTPQSAASAFALGASYILTGSVNQACVESGLSAEGREMLAKADIADVTMAPAADMFELGVELQVLKRGTMFAPRAKVLYRAYRDYESLDEMPNDLVTEIEKKVLGMTLKDCWASTREFWLDRDPDQVSRAEADPHHKMALTFRSYLGLSSRWSIDGASDRRIDYQIWCGPAMGAFNAWAADSFLEPPSQRKATQVALNLLEGAAAITRAHQLRTYGVDLPSSTFDYRPRPLA